MKKLLFSGVLCIFLLTQAIGQTIPCDSMKVDSVWLVEAGINRIAVRMKMLGGNSDFINYPYFPYIFNQLGDTIARGEMFYFGQSGGTIQEYLNMTLLNELPPVIHLRFRFNSDSCDFTYALTSAQGISEFRQPEIFPNPAGDEIHYQNFRRDQAFRLINSAGRILLSGILTGGKGKLDFSEIPAGIYQMLFSNGTAARIIRQ